MLCLSNADKMAKEFRSPSFNIEITLSLFVLQFAFDQWQRAFDREVARQEAEKREAEARRERELQRIRQEKIDRENKELRDKISNSLDDIEDIKRSLDK